MHQQNPPVFNWRCGLTQDDLYNGRKTVVLVVTYLLTNLLIYTIQSESVDVIRELRSEKQTGRHIYTYFSADLQQISHSASSYSPPPDSQWGVAEQKAPTDRVLQTVMNC